MKLPEKEKSKGEVNGPANRLHKGWIGRAPRDVRPGEIFSRKQGRAAATRIDQAARVADQRLRLLHRYALERRARRRRERAASLWPRRVARSALLQRTRARGAGVDRRV